MKVRTCSAILLFLTVSLAFANDSDSTAHYLANEGVMVARGETKIVFDPLFRYPHAYYQVVPEEMEQALFSGHPPFDGIDAVFISHYHADHFSPELILRLLTEREDIQLFAPEQAVDGLRAMTGDEDEPVFDRITSIDLEYLEAPVTLKASGLLIEAVRIPHSGWPEGRLDVQNIAFRVTLDETTTVLHMGDADARDQHFASDAAYWNLRHTDMAFPPYWFFLDPGGRRVLDERLQPAFHRRLMLPKPVNYTG
jgi:L-ascorbate metabolism protein UlaG (beta-lactamase superfamily)